jgi:hypothetical protein
MSVSVAVFWSRLPRRFQHQQLGGAQFHRHVGELEAHALELADLLAELHPIDGPLRGELQRALGAAQAGRRDLQARRPEPGIGDLEAAVQFAEYRALGHAAVVEFENAVGIAAVRDVLVARPHFESRVPMSIKNAVIFLALALRRGLLARGGEQDHVIRVIGMADEMLGAVDDEVPARRTAVVFMLRRSDPAPGSVIARHSVRSPRTVGSR